MGHPTNRPFLFIHSSGPTHMHHRDESIKSEIRRHIMVDIGKARRKSPRNPHVDVLMQPLTEAELQRLESRRSTKTTNRTREEQSAALLSATRADEQPVVPSPTPPFWEQHPLLVLEQQWEMDMFSAYGIALVMSEGRNWMAKNALAAGFWFPFAFRASKFLHQFRHILTSPDMLAAVSSVQGTVFHMIALRRSMGTISCIERILADSDLSRATANNVIRGVLASICYNFVSAEFAQALVHIKGLGLLVSAKGGADSFQDDEDLRLMIFWVDVTAALLFNSRPQFPLPWDLLPELQSSDILPIPLLKLATEIERTEDRYTAGVISCLRDLSAFASYIESELAVRGDALWEDEEGMGLRLNPITYRLLTLSPTPKPTSQHPSVASAIQLGQILWIIWIKRRYRSYPGSPAGYASKLFRLMLHRRVWGAAEADLLSVRLWLLVLCAVSSYGADEQRVTVNMIADVMERMGLGSWSEVMGYICQMPWVSVFDELCVELESKLRLLG